MVLAIDVGNTKIKLAVFEGTNLMESFNCDNSEIENTIELVSNKYQKITDLIVSAVGNIPKEVFLSVKSTINVHLINQNTKFPFYNKYKTPNSLGVDRMVLASGAVLNFPKQNRLVIDAGTCITYDFIDENDNYLGGAISPGIRLRFEALHYNTAKLPLLTLELFKEKNDVVTTQDFIGNTTLDAIKSGVLNGIQNEIEGFINQYQQIYPKFIIILTGGDADFLAKRLKNTIFANSNFLIESLNQTFHYINQNV